MSLAVTADSSDLPRLLVPETGPVPAAHARGPAARLAPTRQWRVTPEALKHPEQWFQSDPPFRLDLPENQDVTVIVESLETSGTGARQLLGRAASDPSTSVTLILEDSRLSGFVNVPGWGSYHLQPSTLPGTVEVSAVRHPGGFCATGCLVHSAATATVDQATMGRKAATLAAADTLTEPTVVDVLFLYTPLALTGEGSEAGLVRRVQAGVDETNLRLANSEVNVRIHTVGIVRYDTFESGGMPRELFRLENATDGFERVPQLRNDYKADIVCLVTELDGDNYLAGATGVAPTLGDPQFSNIIIRRHALAPGSRVLAHEFGHLFGLEHDRENAALPPEGFRTRKPYIFAHRTRIEGVTYIDLMSYEPGIFVPNFSNPRLSIDGVPLGVPADQPNPSDGARAIDEIAPYVAAYRTAWSRVEFSQSRFVGRREESSVRVQLQRVGDLNTSTRVTVIFDATSPARAGIDYLRPTSTLVTFATNEATAELVIPLVAESASVGERTLRLSLGSVAGNHGLGSVTLAEVALFDPGTPTSHGKVEFAGGPLVFPESSGEARIRVRPTGNNPAGTVVLPYHTVPGTAQAGTDFLPISGTLTNLVPGGEWELSVPLLPRPEPGPDRSFFVIVGTRTNTVTILDEQRPGSVKAEAHAVAADGGLNCRLRGDGRLLVWGNFSTIGGVPRSGLALLNQDGSVDESFRPPEILLGHRRMAGIGTTESQTTNAVISLVRPLPDGRLLIAGEFSRVDGAVRRTLMRLQSDGGVDESFGVLDLNGAVKEVLVQADGRILVGGTFTRFNGESRAYLVRLLPDGSMDSSFQPKGGPTSNFVVAILSLAQQSDGRILMGGLFRKVDGLAMTNLARLNVDGTYDPTFRLSRGASGPVTSVRVMEDDRLLVAGFFDTIGNRSSPRIARLQADGTADPTFRSPNPDAEIREIHPLPDGRILISGRFTKLGNVARRSLAMLNADGSVDPSFDAGDGPDVAPGIAAAFASQCLAPSPDGTLWVTGEFSQFNRHAVAGVTRLNLGTVNPRLGFPHRAEGGMAMTVHGLSGGRHPLETSTDLEQWERAGEIRLEGYDTRIGITVPTGESSRFFRLKPPGH
ncbi:MAG: hypothetical protein KF791_09965 [Verrucomicrobiae bacterium]|nr:hypothetical protein [Verrucomicrobiae bacterium]